MKEIVSPIIASNRHLVSTFVTTFAAAAIALPIALTIIPSKTPVKADPVTSNGIVSAAVDPGLGSCVVTGSGSGTEAKVASAVVSVVPGSTTSGLVNVNSGTSVSTGDVAHVHDVNVSALNGINVLNDPNLSVPSGLLGGTNAGTDFNTLTGVTISLNN